MWGNAVEKVVPKLLHISAIIKSHTDKTLSEQEAAGRVMSEIDGLVRSNGHGE